MRQGRIGGGLESANDGGNSGGVEIRGSQQTTGTEQAAQASHEIGGQASSEKCVGTRTIEQI